MKRTGGLSTRLLIVAAVIALALGTGITGVEGARTLNLFNWSDYIPQDVLEDFEQEFGVRVNHDTYSNNEEMMAKLLAGGIGLYDIAVPSDYMIEVLIEENLLEEIDLDRIPNLRHIDPLYLNTPFDPDNRYSLPYMWGTTGIAYNTKYVTEPVTSWNDLWNPAYRGRVLLLDDSREVIGTALQALGYSRNSTDPKELDEARLKMRELAPHVLAYDSDQPKNFLVSEEAWIALIWNGDAALAMEENPNIRYVLPVEGGGIWQDNLVIPKGAPNKDLAHEFINFLYRPDISARLAIDNPYGTPNKDAYDLLPDWVRNNPATYPDQEALQRAEWLTDVGEATVIYDRIYTEIKR